MITSGYSLGKPSLCPQCSGSLGLTTVWFGEHTTQVWQVGILIPSAQCLVLDGHVTPAETMMVSSRPFAGTMVPGRM